MKISRVMIVMIVDMHLASQVAQILQMIAQFLSKLGAYQYL